MESHKRPTRRSGTRLWAKLKPQALAMRREPTAAEALLWERLRNRRFRGLKFRRQHAIGRFIVDFYCAEANLVVELDGGIHDDRQVEDREREKDLNTRGLVVMRFRNERVSADIDTVLDEIFKFTSSHERHSASSPSPRSGEGARG